MASSSGYGPYQSAVHSHTLPCMSGRPHALAGKPPRSRRTLAEEPRAALPYGCLPLYVRLRVVVSVSPVEERRHASRAAGVFPLGLGRQPIDELVVGLRVERGEKLLRLRRTSRSRPGTAGRSRRSGSGWRSSRARHSCCVTSCCPRKNGRLMRDVVLRLVRRAARLRRGAAHREAPRAGLRPASCRSCDR